MCWAVLQWRLRSCSSRSVHWVRAAATAGPDRAASGQQLPELLTLSGCLQLLLPTSSAEGAAVAARPRASPPTRRSRPAGATFAGCSLHSAALHISPLLRPLRTELPADGRRAGPRAPHKMVANIDLQTPKAWAAHIAPAVAIKWNWTSTPPQPPPT
ncbi:hypothetical protein PLESTF_001416300 [Pleodorina starrii]|nr:hypothetical protein PLESTF_001416300 [Pleodorina starrii]